MSEVAAELEKKGDGEKEGIGMKKKKVTILGTKGSGMSTIEGFLALTDEIRKCKSKKKKIETGDVEVHEAPFLYFTSKKVKKEESK